MKSIKYLQDNKVDMDLSLTYFGDVETYNSALKDFQKGLDDKITEIRNAYTHENLNNYFGLMHAIKTDFKYFGFMKLANLAYSQEMAAQGGNIEALKKSYPEFITELTNVKNVIEAYLEIGSGSERKILTGRIILVVDDSDVIRSFIRRIFEDNYVIEFASNGEEALDIIKEPLNQDRIKAILLDLNMPVVDGFAVLDYMKENKLFSKMPVSIISGDYTKQAIDRAYTYPIVSMINKPFKEEKIREIVERTINSVNK